MTSTVAPGGSGRLRSRLTVDLLRSDMKGHGLGWELMRLAAEWARSEGLRIIEGQVLRSNQTMLEMCRELGFVSRPDPASPDIQVVTYQLGPTEREMDKPRVEQRPEPSADDRERLLDEALDASFPASDPVAIGHSDHAGAPPR